MKDKSEARHEDHYPNEALLGLRLGTRDMVVV